MWQRPPLKKKEKNAKPASSKSKAKRQEKDAGFLEKLSAPARRALEAKGITSLQKLARYSEKELLALHGLGKASLPLLNEALSAKGLQLKH